jgi:hypothetical protein
MIIERKKARGVRQREQHNACCLKNFIGASDPRKLLNGGTADNYYYNNYNRDSICNYNFRKD